MMGAEGQEAGSFLLCGRGATDNLAIEGDGHICLRSQRGPHPIGQGPLQMLHADGRKPGSDRANRWAEKPPGTEEPC